MQFQPVLAEARLVRRYKRFLADVRMPDGTVQTLHCPNTGAMTGCAEPGMRIWYATSSNPRRKYRHTWELAQTAAGALLCVHSQRANMLVREWLESGGNCRFDGNAAMVPEPPTPDGRGRFDFLLDGALPAVIEVKSVTLAGHGGVGRFPDAVSVRATRHLQQLVAAAASGQRAVLVFAALHTGIESVEPARDIDPAYADALAAAVDAGVEVLALGADITPRAITLVRELPVRVSRDR